MTNIGPRRAWAAAATVTAIAIAGFASVADASTQTLVGVNSVTFAWQPASGQPGVYLVSRSLNGGALKAYAYSGTNQIQIPTAPGDQIQISVAAGGYDSAGAFRVGPTSPLSDPVVVLAAPQLPAAGSWLLRCRTCPAMERRSLGNASLVAATSAGLPMPWKVLGHARLDQGGEAIVWHNTQTREIALWDWASLTPIAVESSFIVPAPRGVGAADLDRDGSEEFLVQRVDTLAVSAWGLTATGFRRVANLSVPPGATLAAARDFDRDGRVDLLWHDPVAGTIDLARFIANPILGNGATAVSLAAPLLTRLISGISWDAQVASTGDYDGDGWADVLLRYSTGRLAILYLRNGAADDFVLLPSAPDDVNRVVVGSPNVDARYGKEIALQHRPTGELSIVDPTITSRAARTVVLSAGSKWQALAIGQ